MNRELLRTVRQRAADRCEYCLMPSFALPLPFQIDHIVAGKHGGQSVRNNWRSPARTAIASKARTSPELTPPQAKPSACFIRAGIPGRSTSDGRALAPSAAPPSAAPPFMSWP